MTNHLYNDDLLLLPKLSGVESVEDFKIGIDGIGSWFDTDLGPTHIEYSDINIISGDSSLVLDDRNRSITLAKGIKSDVFVGSGQHSLFVTNNELNIKQTDGETILYVESFADTFGEINLDGGTISIYNGDLELGGLQPEIKENKIFLGDYETGFTISETTASDALLIINDLASASSTTFSLWNKSTEAAEDLHINEIETIAHAEKANLISSSTTTSVVGPDAEGSDANTHFEYDTLNYSDPVVFNGNEDLIIKGDLNFNSPALEEVELQINSFVFDANDEIISIYSGINTITNLEHLSDTAEKTIIEISDYHDLNVIEAVDLIEDS